MASLMHAAYSGALSSMQRSTAVSIALFLGPAQLSLNEATASILLLVLYTINSQGWFVKVCYIKGKLRSCTCAECVSASTISHHLCWEVGPTISHKNVSITLFPQKWLLFMVDCSQALPWTSRLSRSTESSSLTLITLGVHGVGVCASESL